MLEEQVKSVAFSCKFKGKTPILVRVRHVQVPFMIVHV